MTIILQYTILYIQYIRSKFNKLIGSRNIKIFSDLILFIKLASKNTKNLTFLSEVGVRSSRPGSSMLRTPLHINNLYDKTCTVTACGLWNFLSSSLRSIETPGAVCGDTETVVGPTGSAMLLEEQSWRIRPI